MQWVAFKLSGGMDITELVQRFVDYGPYEPGDFFGLVLESASGSTVIPENSLKLHIEWMELFKEFNCWL